MKKTGIVLLACLMMGGPMPLMAEMRGLEGMQLQEQMDNADQLKEMKKLAKQCKLPKVKVTEKQITTSMNMVTMMGLRRQGDYVVTGAGFQNGKITLQNIRDIANAVKALAVAADKQGGEYQTNFNLLLDYLSSQNIYAQMPKYKYSNYDDVRKVPADFLSALSACNDVRKEGIVNGVMELLEWNIVRKSDRAARQWVSSDYLFNAIPHIYLCAALNPNKEQGLKDMQTFAHFLDICTIYSPGGMDLLKPDGTGFHHRTHYIGYMYSYRTWIEYMHKLKGTSFRMSKGAYERMAKAVVSEYLMATNSPNDKEHLVGNSMAGRHPFGGMRITMNAQVFEKLIEVGGDIMGKEIDEELAAYYNAFYQTEKYKGIAPAKLDGYYQFNYSPAGVYRKDNWVAVMRCPTAKFWGGEVYAKTNRFGRYQAHGTLEIIYEGGLTATGYPAGEKAESAGWDWNMMPGSTTVHYTDWKALMPAGNNKDRFDQFAKTTTFAGALAGDNCGLFAADFDQIDTWAQQRYVPTNLQFKKSVLAVDGMLFSVGNGISAQGEYPEWTTGTNLFQSVMAGNCKELNVDGKKVKKGEKLTVEQGKAVWMLAPTSTGYYVPAGHDEIVISHKDEKSHASTGIDDGSMGKLTIAKAYINHGNKPANKEYRFLAVPAATQEKMTQVAKDFEAGKLFEVAAMNENLHVVKYAPKQMVAYTFFAPVSGLEMGNVKGSETELLVMETAVDGGMKLSLCNPNLRPKDLAKKMWMATETSASVELNGKWTLAGGAEGVKAETNANGNTVIKVTLKDGAKVDLELKK